MYLLAFGVFIIFFQVFQFVNTKNLTDSYYKIISDKNRLIVSINSILLESSTLQRSLLTLNLSTDSLERVKMNQRITESEKKIEQMIHVIKADSTIDKEVSVFFERLKIDYIVYKGNFQIFLKIIEGNDKSEIDSFRKKELREALDAFQKSQTEFLELLIKIENRQMKCISKKSNRTGWILLLTGNGILFVILMFMVYILYTERKKTA